MASSLFKGFKHAKLYSKFRPSPPHELIEFINNYLRGKIQGSLEQAVDIGCGTGQSTIVLAPYFKKVTGFDISEAQIESAQNSRSLPNVEYKVADCLNLPVPDASVQLVTSSQAIHWVADCLNLPVPDASVQLVTSSQAIHWFDLTQIFTEFKRILVPNGVVAVYGYWIPMPHVQDKEKDENITNLISKEFHDKHLGKYWDDGRYIHLRNCYNDFFFPFADTKRLNMTHKTESSLADYINYLSTWSAYQKLYQEDNMKAEALLKSIEMQLFSILDRGSNKTAEEISFSLHTDFFLVIGHH